MNTFQNNPKEIMSLRESLVLRWPEVVHRLNMDPDDWKLEEVSHREEARVARIVVRATRENGTRLTLKHELRPWDSDQFSHQYACHNAAFAAYPKSDEFAVSRPILLDADQQCALFEYAEGKNLKDHLTFLCNNPDAQLKLVEAAGRWLDIFHRSRITEKRRYNVSWSLNRFGTIRCDLGDGRIEVPARALFLDGISKIEKIAKDVTDVETYGCVQHGDFHIGNLIWDGTCMTGIDISAKHVAPVGYDICQFLVDFVRRFWKAPEAGQVIPPEVLDAFFAGYTLVGKDDPSVCFLSFVQVLESWLQIPKNQTDRTKAKQLSIKQLRPIAKRAFCPTSI